MKADLCGGCAECPLATEEACAPPTGPADAKVLVVGEAPGRQEADLGKPFVGASGTMLRRALQQFDIDPETEVRYANTVQCRPPNNENPSPMAQARCTVLADELAAFQGRVVLAVGKVAVDRLLGKTYTSRLNKARSPWDGYVHPIDVIPDRVDLGHELGHFGEVYKSGKRKGEPKQTKRLLAGQTPRPVNAVGVVGSLHPSAVMRRGFSNVVQFKAAVQRAALVANGFTPPSLYELSGVEEAVESPLRWTVCDDQRDIDLIFDIENTEEGITYISFVEVTKGGRIGQRASFPWGPAVADLSRSLLGKSSPYRTLVAHNAAYDCGQLLAFDQIHVRGSGVGERGEGLADTMMAAQLDQPDLPKGLGAMWRYLPPMPPWKHVSGTNMRMYNLLDSVITAQAWHQLRRRLSERGQRTLLRTEMASIMVLDRMTRNGLPIDKDRMAAWIEKTEGEIEILKGRWKEMTGLEVQSGKQVLGWVFDTCGAPVLDTTDSGQPRLDNAVMEKLVEGHESEPLGQALSVLMRWKELNKQISTYGKGYLERMGEDGCLHPSYLPDVKDSGDLGTAAGRLSSSPNVQNIPKDLRWMVRAPRGYVVGDSDLRAVEGRVQAVLAEDHELLEMYDRPGFDMHTYNLERAKAALRGHWERLAVEGSSTLRKHARARLEAVDKDVWPITRKNMKTFLYGWNYGAGDTKIAKSLEIPLREAVVIREAYEASRPATARWRKAVVRSAATRRLLQNSFGRIRYFPGIVPEVNVRNQAINFFPQSTVADMMWAWFPEIEELLAEHGGWLITQVHDSFIYLLPEAAVDEFIPKLDALMTQEWPEIAPGFRVPATHDIGPSWGEVEPWQPKADVA